MAAPVTGRSRPVYITRSGSAFQLTFPYDPRLVERVKELPYAQFTGAAKTWAVLVCDQSVQALRKMYYDGLTDVSVDDLLEDGESPEPCAPATLRSGTAKRPFVVTVGLRDSTYEKLAAIPGASWDKKSRTLRFPPLAAPALAEFATRGVLADPEKLLSPAENVIAFDTRTGRFSVRGADPRAGAAFAAAFPKADVASIWRDRGLDIAFSDPFTEEVYRGEVARNAPLRDPEGLKIDLFDYQKRNVAIAMQRTGFAIVDEPGLGKTPQAIAVGAGLLLRGEVSRVCVLVPAAVRTQWANEIQRFTGADPSQIVVVRGDPRKRSQAYADAADAQWFVVHYDVLSKDLNALAPLFAGALVVADEAHRLKSYRSARTAAALKLCQGASRRLALSGTPLETGVEEWYQVLSGFAVPGFLGDPKTFNARYRYETKFGYEGARNLSELRERSLPHFSRHTKAEVAKHLPPLRVEQLVLDPDLALAAALRRAHREAADEIEKYRAAQLGTPADTKITGGLFGEEEDGPSGAEMNATGQLRMLCSSPRLVLASKSDAAAALVGAGLVPDVDGPKLDELRVMAADFHAISEARRLAAGDTPATPQDVQQERFVVFTFSKTMANLIAERFREDGISHVLYTGDVGSTARDAAVAQFTDPNSDVLAFIATDAAAEGLNLGRCCSTLIQFDPAWTPSRAQQRVNRIHRVDGTASKYQVINMVMANSMEIGVYQLLAHRADLQDTLLGEAGTRYKATGRRSGGRNVFEEAMANFADGLAVPRARREKLRTAGTAAVPAAAQVPAPAVPDLEPLALF